MIAHIVELAIAQSIETGRISHIDAEDEGVSRDELTEALTGLADDTADGEEFEAWGEDEDGSEWRVHVI